MWNAGGRRGSRPRRRRGGELVLGSEAHGVSLLPGWFRGHQGRPTVKQIASQATRTPRVVNTTSGRGLSQATSSAAAIRGADDLEEPGVAADRVDGEVAHFLFPRHQRLGSVNQTSAAAPMRDDERDAGSTPAGSDQRVERGRRDRPVGLADPGEVVRASDRDTDRDDDHDRRDRHRDDHRRAPCAGPSRRSPPTPTSTVTIGSQVRVSSSARASPAARATDRWNGRARIADRVRSAGWRRRDGSPRGRVRCERAPRGGPVSIATSPFAVVTTPSLPSSTWTTWSCATRFACFHAWRTGLVASAADATWTDVVADARREGRGELGARSGRALRTARPRDVAVQLGDDRLRERIAHGRMVEHRTDRPHVRVGVQDQRPQPQRQCRHEREHAREHDQAPQSRRLSDSRPARASRAPRLRRQETAVADLRDVVAPRASTFSLPRRPIRSSRRNAAPACSSRGPTGSPPRNRAPRVRPARRP